MGRARRPSPSAHAGATPYFAAKRAPKPAQRAAVRILADLSVTAVGGQQALRREPPGVAPGGLAYYRVGVLRWGILSSPDDLRTVEWNLGAEPMLSDLLEAAIDERQAVELAVAGRTGVVEWRRCQLEGWDVPPLVHRTYRGRWEDGSAAQLRFLDILDIR